MKKLLIIFGLLVVAIAVQAQVKGYTVEATEYMILQGDTIRTNSPVDGEIIKRVAGVWTNGTGGAGSAAVDSLTWNFANGDLGWYISGSVAGSVNLDERYVELSDTLTGGAYYSQNQVDNLLVDAQTTVFRITLPIAGTLAGSVALAVEGVDYPSGWVLTASGGDLQVNHGLNRERANVTVKYNSSGSSYRQLRNFADAYSGIFDVDDNNVNIESITQFYTAFKIKIYITFR